MIRQVLWGFILVGLVASLWSASHRWRAERDNRTVEITLDYAELRTLAAATGKPVASVLRRFREAGATSVAVEENNISGLEQQRRLFVVPTADYTTTDIRTDAPTAQRIAGALQNKTHDVVTTDAAPDPAPAGTVGDTDIIINQPYNQVRAVGVGLDPDTVQIVQASGLGIIGRVNNYVGVNGKGVGYVLQSLKDAGVSTVLFSGDEVLGHKGFLVEDKGDPARVTTSGTLEALNLHYATVEFGKQKGDLELQKAVPDLTVRVHTVPGSEMAQAEIPGNIQRFLLGARERNIRLLFVRLFLGEADMLETNAHYVEEIRDRLKTANLSPGRAHGYGPLATPRWLRGLIGLGLVGAWLLLLDSITGLFAGEGGPGRFVWAVAVGGALVLAGLPMTSGFMGPKLAALAAACLFPSLALLHSDQLRSGTAYQVRPLAVAFLRFALASAITGVGIAAIIGLLADRIFLIKADAFLGIKGAQLVPVLLVAAVYAGNLRADDRQTWHEAVAKVRGRLIALASNPILLWQVGAALAVVVLLAFLVMRSGNDPGVGVSAFELKTRGFLDMIMPARPRFKEFAFGHPALFLAFVLAARGWRKAALPLFLLGAIGQVSLLNTFCHLHTPIPVSLSRALIGLGLGVIIALVVYPFLNAFLRRLPPPRVSP